MRFNTWFKLWMFSFFRLFTFDYKKPSSKAQREKARARRLQAKYSSKNLYRNKRKHKAKRSSTKVQNTKLLRAIGGFFAVSFGLLLLPLGLLDWGNKNIQIKKQMRQASGNVQKTQKRKGATKKRAPQTKAEKVTSAPFYGNAHKQNSIEQPNVFLKNQSLSTQEEESNLLTIEQMQAYKLSVVKDGERNINAVVRDEKQSLGVLWKENVEIFFSNCQAGLQEGKLLIDAVERLSVSKGRITAAVKTQRNVPYKVIITIEPMGEKDVQDFYTSGENVKKLFPSKKDFWLFCNCGQELCAHSFAVLYAVGNMFDECAEKLYLLRGAIQ